MKPSIVKPSLVASAIVLAFVAEGVLAACPGVMKSSSLAFTNMILNDKTVCATRFGDSWQEEHHANGELWDYKLGIGVAAAGDPRQQVGTWTANADGSVTHAYTGGDTYTYELYYENFSFINLSFCATGATDPASSIDATRVIGINVGCP